MANSNTEPQIRSKKAQDVFQAYSALNTDDKLALLYFIYENMGDSITPAAPAAAEPELAPKLLGEFYQLSGEDQLAVMRSLVNREDTEYSHAYGALTANNQLVVWYAWARDMGDTVIGLPSGYQAAKAVNDALAQVKGLEFEEQISLFREIASQMGYSSVHAIPSQAETGKTPSL